MKVDVPDIMSWLLDTKSISLDQEVNHMWLKGDSRVLIVAGSDPIAATLTFCFHQLAQDPKHIGLIRAELDSLKANEGDYEAARLQKEAHYLNAFISEVLRLYPANPSGFLRQTPDEGLHIGGNYIPGHVTVGIPLWTLHRCTCFLCLYHISFGFRSLHTGLILHSSQMLRQSGQILTRAMAP